MEIVILQVIFCVIGLGWGCSVIFSCLFDSEKDVDNKPDKE